MDTQPGSESPTKTRPSRGRSATSRPSAPAGRTAEAAIEPKPLEGELVASDSAAHAPEHLAPAIEALLLSVDRPLALARIAEALGLVADEDDGDAVSGGAEPAEPLLVAQSKGKRSSRKPAADSPSQLIATAIGLLNSQYESTARAFRIEKLAGGYRVMTLPKFAAVLAAYHGRRERQALSKAAVETLSIVAYKQPLTRATLEAIRGVACGEVLRSLTERRLVTIVGRAEEVGRPILYGTTKQFLELFGLSSVKDLPSVDEFKLRGVHGAGSDDD
jgi:segregation and condensation protein B